jgi:hypothetical protein
MNFIYLTTFLYLLFRAYYMYMYICYYLLNSVFLKNKCYKIINQLVVEIRLTENLSKPLYTRATVVQMQCKTKSKMDFFGHFVMICMHIKLTNA